MPDYFDLDGFKVEMLEWALLFENTRERVVKASFHKEGGRRFLLSTVWLGLNHRFTGDGPPLIFETMAFEQKPTAWNSVHGELDFDGVSQRRYSTREEALEGHDPWQMRGGRW